MNETIRSIKHVGEKLDNIEREFTEEAESQKEILETSEKEIPHTKMQEIVPTSQLEGKNIFALAVKEMITINIIKADNFNNEDSKRKLDQLEKVSDQQLGLQYARKQSLSCSQTGKLTKQAEEFRNFPYFTEMAPLAQAYVKKHKDFAIEMLEMERSKKKFIFKAGTIAEQRFDYELSEISEDNDSKLFYFLLIKYR